MCRDAQLADMKAVPTAPQRNFQYEKPFKSNKVYSYRNIKKKKIYIILTDFQQILPIIPWFAIKLAIVSVIDMVNMKKYGSDGRRL